ncbi:MAG: MFS transporter [Gammaproteobacteria bacterium]|nr:MAG: MFS transporter [Gammaproteobacteria bacterium]
MIEATRQTSWLDPIKLFFHPRVIALFFLGISAGIPLLLIFSSLSLWLREAGLDRAAVTYFSWAALGYSFKFVWAPLVDTLPLPFLTSRLGRRRGWLFLSQVMVITAIIMMALTDPAHISLGIMAAAAVFLGFSSATQDIVIDAYRIESAEDDLQALMSSTYIAGYRTGMIISGAGALLLASYWGSTSANYNYDAWKWSYLTMAGIMSLGLLTTLIISEPSNALKKEGKENHIGFLLLFIFSAMGFVASFYFSGSLFEEIKLNLAASLHNAKLASVIIETCRLSLGLAAAVIIAKVTISLGIVKSERIKNTYLAPINDFFQRYGWSFALLLLALIGFYRISDIVLGVIANVFYQDMGFTKTEIASVVKSFGLLMTIAGGFLGGLLAVRFGVIKILFLGALLSSLTNLLFMLLAQSGHDMTLLYLVISADNLSSGLASAAFIAFLSSLTNISFTAVQYAIFSSLMTLLPKILGGYSGQLVETFSYSYFFLITALIGLPVLLLIVLADRKFKFNAVTIKAG